MSCVCNDCGKNYKVDVMIPKVLWDEIRKNESNINMLCGSCIFKRIEDLNRYDYFHLNKNV